MAPLSSSASRLAETKWRFVKTGICRLIPGEYFRKPDGRRLTTRGLNHSEKGSRLAANYARDFIDQGRAVDDLTARVKYVSICQRDTP